MNKREKAKARKRMRTIVARFQTYVWTYSDPDVQPYYDECNDKTFLLDMLYGIGIAIDPTKYREGSGFDAFKADLLNKLSATSGAAHG